MALPPQLTLLKDRLLTQYPFELAMFGLVIINLLQYFLGKKQNQSKLVKWLSPLRPYLLSQFAHIGTSNTHNTAFFSEESKNEFHFHASGRVNCAFMRVNHTLIKRQDLLTRLTVQLVSPSKDQCIYDIPVEGTVPMVFSVVRKRLHKTLYADNTDLTNLGNKFTRDGLTDSYVVFAENQETVDYVLDSCVLDVLNRYSCVE